MLFGQTTDKAVAAAAGITAAPGLAVVKNFPGGWTSLQAADQDTGSGPRVVKAGRAQHLVRMFGFVGGADLGSNPTDYRAEVSRHQHESQLEHAPPPVLDA